MTDYLPGTAGLIEDIDKKHLVVLRDGRTLIGILRAIDQFANLVLHQTVERIHVDGFFGDIPRGIFVVRGTFQLQKRNRNSIKKNQQSGNPTNTQSCWVLDCPKKA